MSALFWAAVVAAWYASVWLAMHYWYKRIHRCSLRWWAVPFAHGAVLFARRLPGRFER